MRHAVGSWRLESILFHYLTLCPDFPLFLPGIFCFVMIHWISGSSGRLWLGIYRYGYSWQWHVLLQHWNHKALSTSSIQWSQGNGPCKWERPISMQCPHVCSRAGQSLGDKSRSRDDMVHPTFHSSFRSRNYIYLNPFSLERVNRIWNVDRRSETLILC